MSDSDTGYRTRLEPRRQSKYLMSYSHRVPISCGAYGIDHLTQDEAIAYFPDGKIRGVWTPGGDSQSDDIAAPSVTLTSEGLRVVLGALKPWFEEQLNHCWEFEESSTGEALTDSVVVERPALAHDVETTSDDISQWPSAQLESEILQANAESDMPRLREMILVAEDTGFTPEESGRLAPWLLSFAERRRDSGDPQDEAAVWSAIRTGASMLAPDAANRLRSLLEPGHSIETSLVAVKMLGRIFEAQPPVDVDQHEDLAGDVRQIAESLLNRYAITVSQSAAMALLAIHAIAAMASSQTLPIVELAKQLDAVWFTRRARRKLGELRDIWTSPSATVSERPLTLLGRAIETLGAD